MYQTKGTGRGSLQQGLAWAKEGLLGLVSGPTESEPGPRLGQALILAVTIGYSDILLQHYPFLR